MRINYASIFQFCERYRVFIILALVFGFLTPWYGFFLVDLKTFDPYLLYIADFFSTFEGQIYIAPLIFGFGCVILYWIIEVFKNNARHGFRAEIPSNKLLEIALILIATSIVSLFLAFPAANPHEFQIIERNYYYEVCCVPSHNLWETLRNPFWWKLGDNFSYLGAYPTLEIVNFNLDIGFILSSFILIFISCEIILQRLLLHHYYVKYLPEIANKSSLVRTKALAYPKCLSKYARELLL